MNKLYIIIEVNRSSYNDKLMVPRNSEREVISYVSSISTRDAISDSIEVERVFSVTDTGKVTHHEIKFKGGRLVLEDVVEVQQTQFG